MLPGRAHGGGVRVVEILRMGLGIVDVTRRIMDPVGAGGGTRQRLGQDGQPDFPSTRWHSRTSPAAAASASRSAPPSPVKSPIGDRLESSSPFAVNKRQCAVARVQSTSWCSA